MSKLIIIISGGCLTGVFSDDVQAEVVILDYDNKAACDCENCERCEVCTEFVGFEKVEPLSKLQADDLEVLNRL